MTASRDLEQLIRAYLDEGPSALADQSFDAVRFRLERTRQRAVLGPWREPQMSTFVRVAIAAAAAVVVAIAGFSLITRPDPGPGASPSLGPSPTASALTLPAASLVSGTSYRINYEMTVGSHPMTFTVPGDGWFSIDPAGILGKDVLPSAGNVYDIAFSVWIVGNVYADACQWQGAEISPRVGPTIEDLATALAAQAGRSGSSPADVTVGGYDGKLVELSLPPDLDLAACDDGDLHTWIPADGNGYGGYVYGTGQRNSVYILDVAGDRIVLDTMYLPGTSASDLAELAQLLESIRFE